jgi:hypothetical protein
VDRQVKRKIVWAAIITLILIWLLPQAVEWIRATYLTLQHGNELAEAAMRFEVVTDSSSGSRDKYYAEERPKFGHVATEFALRGRLIYWDSVWENAPDQVNLYLVTEQRLTAVRVVEYDDSHAKMVAEKRWHQRVINRETRLTIDEGDAGAEMRYWFAREDGTWKVSDFEAASPPKW